MLDTLGAIVGPTSALWLLGAFDWRSASGRDPAFLNAFLADPMSEIRHSGILLDITPSIDIQWLFARRTSAHSKA
jgi:hypothetical protein